MPSASLLASTDPVVVSRIDGPPTASRLLPRMVELQAPDVHLVLGANEAAQSVIDEADSGDDGQDDGGMIGATGALDPGDAVPLEEADAAAPEPSCRARCSLWWSATPTYRGRATGLIGHYAAADEAAAAELLEAALDRLRDAGCRVAVGPMDGNAWFMHRFATGGSDRPPFLLEPAHPPAYPKHFLEAGFSPVARYRSARASLPDDVDAPGVAPSGDGGRLRARGLDPEQREADVEGLYDLLLDARAGRPFYKPLSRLDFTPLYDDLLSEARPPLVRLAETPDGDLAGLALLLPDRLQGRRAETVDTAVLHDVAVRPTLDVPAVTRWLAADACYAAANRGFEEVVVAPRPDDADPALPDATALRQYALFGQEL